MWRKSKLSCDVTKCIICGSCILSTDYKRNSEPTNYNHQGPTRSHSHVERYQFTDTFMFILYSSNFSINTPTPSCVYGEIGFGIARCLNADKINCAFK